MAVIRPRTAPSTTPAGFAELGVPAALVKVLTAGGITHPTPIQAHTLPDSLAGRDVLGRGRTGSGKTYAFLLPLLARLSAGATKRQPGKPRALILVPTRELATQVHAAMAPLADALSLRTLTVFGGVGARPQISALRSGVDVVVACPGRLADHVESGHASLDLVEITVLDEADHMADLGFLPVVRRLMQRTPREGQRMLFSATLDGGVDVLARQFMNRPVTHEVDSAQSAPPKMAHHVLHLRHEDRLPILVDLASTPGRTLVFTRTKHGAKKLTKQLIASGVPAVELHGNLAQNARERNLRAFSDGVTNTLVATDIAARGVHVDDVALVIHADPPIEHKAYLHRSGRTARAGAAGIVITLTTDDQHREVRDLTRKAGVNPTTTSVHPGHALLAQLSPGERNFVAPPPAQTRDTARRATGNGRGTSRHTTAVTAQEGGRTRHTATQEGGRTRHTGAKEGGNARHSAAQEGGRARHASGQGATHGRGTGRRGTSTAQDGGNATVGSKAAGHATAASSAGGGSRGVAAFSARSRAGGRRTSR